MYSAHCGLLNALAQLVPLLAPVALASTYTGFEGVMVGAQRAQWFEVLPPAVVNAPPATRAPLYTVKAETEASTPLPRADQDEEKPFHRAIRLALAPPAVVKSPPAMRLP